MKTSSWFLAIEKEDEEALRAFELLRQRGCFNTRLWRWNRRDEMARIYRWYVYPKRNELAETLAYHFQVRANWRKESRKMKDQIKALKSKIKDLEAEAEAGWQAGKQIDEAEAQAQYMDQAFEYAIQCGLAPGWSELPDINQFGIEKDKIGSKEFVDQVAKAIHGLKSGSNARFVTPDMSATLGRGTHVLIDVDKVPKDLQVLLAKMMDTLNNHTLRISNLENC